MADKATALFFMDRIEREKERKQKGGYRLKMLLAAQDKLRPKKKHQSIVGGKVNA